MHMYFYADIWIDTDKCKDINCVWAQQTTSDFDASSGGGRHPVSLQKPEALPPMRGYYFIDCHCQKSPLAT